MVSNEAISFGWGYIGEQNQIEGRSEA